MTFQPFFATLVAVIMGKDQLTMLNFSCGLLIIAGIYIAQKSKQDAGAKISES